MKLVMELHLWYFLNSAELLSETPDVQQTVGDESTLMAHLVDGLILLYNMSAHKQLGKVVLNVVSYLVYLSPAL